MGRPQETAVAERGGQLVRIDDTQTVIDLLSHEIHISWKTHRQIAEEASIAASTVSKLYYRETRYPRHGTVMALLGVFGYEVFVKRRSN